MSRAQTQENLGQPDEEKIYFLILNTLQADILEKYRWHAASFGIVHDCGFIHDVVEVREARVVDVHGAGDDETHAPGQHHQDVDGGHLPVLYVLKMSH